MNDNCTDQYCYRYTNESSGDSTQLTYLRSRYYASGTGRFLTRDTWDGDENNPMSFNRWMYVQGNPINYFDPTGHITESEAEKADAIVKMLQDRFSVQINKDWGYSLIPIDNSLMSPLIVPVKYGCKWESGKWNFVELRTIRAAVKDLGKAMNGDGQFKKFIGPIIMKKVDKTCGRGCTPNRGRDILFQDSGKLPTNVDIRNTATTIDKWSVVHELGHAWDRNSGWILSGYLMDFTGGYFVSPGQNVIACSNVSLPGCNSAGYYYGGIPPKGSDNNFNPQEDFAESVAAFVYPHTAEERVAYNYEYDPELKQYLFYPDYTQTSRWKFINGLINLGVRY